MTVAVDRAYEWTKERLLDGTFADGELLSEGQVAQELGISRTPVREAFLRLQAESFLRLYPKRGALVVPVSLTEARELSQARTTIEEFALRAVAHRGDAELAELGKELTAKADAAGSATGNARMQAILDFHRTLVAAAGNSVVTDMYRGLSERMLRLVAAALNSYDPVRDAEEHRELAELVGTGQVAAAVELLRRHITGSFGRFG
ncbi:GntR family transcriptional regulator [Nocardia crassostreae]|uniref:GntR family transcriptional regulator n=1 Tax=Nocardia crassostreae TaxID=53428 RepID=UPI000A5D1288|nr:GntR family transcriptional regulator [Nocardia crassostreae]